MSPTTATCDRNLGQQAPAGHKQSANLVETMLDPVHSISATECSKNEEGCDVLQLIRSFDPPRHLGKQCDSASTNQEDADNTQR